MFIKKYGLKNFTELTGNHLWRILLFNYVFNVLLITSFSKPHTGFFLSFAKLFRTFFYRILPGDCFWIGLMVKKFNYVSLIFLNLQLYHTPLKWSLILWCNEERLLIGKMLVVISGTAIICEWNHREHVLTFFRT